MTEWRQEIRRRLADLNLAPAREAEIVEELSQHLEDHYAEMLANGATEVEAERRTLEELCEGAALRRELLRVEHEVAPEPIVLGTNGRSNMIADLWQDLRYGARMLAKKPGFTAIAILTLALGMGANTAIFSVVNAVLLRPLPFKEPSRLAMVFERRPTSGEANLPVATYEFAAWRGQSQSFESLALIQTAGLNLTGGGRGGGKAEAETIKAWRVSPEFFSLLGIPLLQGRAFVTGEDKAGSDQIAVLNQSLWRRRFASDPNIIGQTISLNDQPFTVVGVIPQLDLMPDLLLPFDLTAVRTSENDHDSTSVMGRLKAGVTIEQANRELAQIARQLELSDPNNTGHGVHVISLHENTVGNVSRALWVLFGAVAFVLLIACANVANLLLARAVARQQEIALRSALGATQFRIIRQLLTESLLLAALSGGLGLLLASWLTDLLPNIQAVNLPRLEQIGIDGEVLAATIGFSLLTGLLTGIAPAWHGYTPNLSWRLLEGRRGLNRSHSGSLLIVLELALTLILLVGSGLMLKSFAQLVRVDPGFDPSNVLRVALSLPALRYPEAEQQVLFYQQLLERLKALPGVEAVGATSQSPLLDSGSWGAVAIEGRSAPPPGQETYVAVTSISADYFRTMRIPLLRGRAFTAFDGAQSAPVAIINETMARRFWPNEDPLGQRLRADGGRALTVAGVVGDVRHGGLNARPIPEMFVPHQQSPNASLTVMVRTAIDPLMLAATVREEVAALDQDLPAPITTMERLISGSVAGQRFNALLLGAFGALALVLTVFGVFGVINYSVAQRTHEIGVRIALGAQRRDIFELIIGQGMRLAFLGIGIGLLGALALTRILADMLYEVSPVDAATFTLVPLLLMGVTLLACYVPARRAAKVDPMIALRCE
jgi:putative ABC transport system permease protein